MIFTAEERQLLMLYYYSSAVETVEIIRDALNDITDPAERIAAFSLLRKLDGVNELNFGEIEPEMRCFCV